MKPYRIAWTVLAILGLASHAWADDALTPIAPLVNQRTVAVIRVDMSGINFDALEKWAKESVTQQNLVPVDQQAQEIKKIHEGLQSSRDWADRFTKAGGKTLWIVAIDSYGPTTSTFIAVPLAPGADVKAIKANFRASNKDDAGDPDNRAGGFIKVGNVLVYNPGPTPLELIPAQAQPDLAKALGSAAPGVVQAAFVPTVALRNLFDGILGELPDGQPATVLTRALSAVTLSLQMSPQITGQLVIQSSDNASIQKFFEILKANVDMGKKALKGVPATVPATQPTDAELHPAQVEQIMIDLADDLLTHARIDGDKLVVDLDTRKLGTLVVIGDLIGAIHESRPAPDQPGSVPTQPVVPAK